MNELSLLAGKVSKRSLPVLRGSAPATSPALKRLLLPQGELAQFYDADKPIRYIAFIELREGSVRGNHYHKFKEEFIYVIRGELEILAEDLNSKARATLPLQTGDLAVIQTGVAHALRTLRPGQAIEFSEVRFDSKDIYRHPLA
jgi:mannose-6-phosphate isomerase-like protein (cupin superfamily)